MPLELFEDFSDPVNQFSLPTAVPGRNLVIGQSDQNYWMEFDVHGGFPYGPTRAAEKATPLEVVGPNTQGVLYLTVGLTSVSLPFGHGLRVNLNNMANLYMSAKVKLGFDYAQALATPFIRLEMPRFRQYSASGTVTLNDYSVGVDVSAPPAATLSNWYLKDGVTITPTGTAVPRTLYGSVPPPPPGINNRTLASTLQYAESDDWFVVAWEWTGLANPINVYIDGAPVGTFPAVPSANEVDMMLQVNMPGQTDNTPGVPGYGKLGIYFDWIYTRMTPFTGRPV
jgi:hypothetical protein